MHRSLTATSALVRSGVVAFAVGFAAIVVTFAGYAAGDTERPLWQNLLCLLAPLGLALALAGLARDSRAQSRQAARAFPAVPLALNDDPQRQLLHTPIKLGMRVVAVAETLSWLLLIMATVVKYTAGNEVGVQILGPTHGTLFMIYVVLALITWRALGWSLLTLGVVLVESFVPGGGFLVARRTDLARHTDSQRRADLARPGDSADREPLTS